MEKRLSRFGVGPRIAAAAVLSCAAAAFATWEWPGACILAWLPYRWCAVAATVLLAIGVPMWAVAVFRVMRAYNRDQLVTTGWYALVRHPMYSGWIVFILPGLVLLTRSWPLLLAPLAAYAVFRRLIHVEDEYLEKRYGQAWLDYRARVNAVIPLPRLRG